MPTPKPRSDLVPNTAAYENLPLVKATGFREYDARWLFGPDINLLGVQALGLDVGAQTEAKRLDAEQVDIGAEQPARVVFAKTGRLDQGQVLIVGGVGDQVAAGRGKHRLKVSVSKKGMAHN